jgi:predicted component of type VI protein secretion system
MPDNRTHLMTMREFLVELRTRLDANEIDSARAMINDWLNFAEEVNRNYQAQLHAMRRKSR